jgi:predicted SAM-dependent methyltransferase
MSKPKKEKGVWVNLGCGDFIIPGWINIDDYKLAEENKYFIRGNVMDIPISSNSVDYLLMDQVLEHIAVADIPRALHEVKRVLKTDGRLVIIVPDFRSAVEQWLKHNPDGSYQPQIHHYFSEVIYGNQNHEGEFHKTAMTPGFLNYNLQMVGFQKREIVFWPEGGKCPEYPGVRNGEGMYLRNAQLVADVIKT